MRVFRIFAFAAAVFSSSSRAWLPTSGKIRGVNVGSMFVFEPWLDYSAWSAIGCNGQQSEFDCVMNTGQERSDTAFQDHWRSWINSDDLDQMASYGLNTIRIPLGYWLKEDLVDSSEHFPRGGFEYLTTFCGEASDRGFYIILDLHGVPGAQQASQPFTGQFASSVGFYNDYNYNRAIEWLKWIVEVVHTTDEFRNVGMLEVINEPLQWANAVDSLRSSYYVNAYNAIREVEGAQSVPSRKALHIQMMSSLWGSGDPTEFLDDTTFTALDTHRYVKWDTSVEVSKDAYLAASCSDSKTASDTLIVGEWSLSVPDDVASTADWDPDTNQDFYRDWFAAQTQSYEKSLGWIFWSWKSGLGDYRWSYKDAVEAGVILTDLDSVASTQVC